MTEQLRDLEARVLTTLPTIQALQELAISGIQSEHFVYYEDLYLYLQAAVAAHNVLPSLRDLSQVFKLPAGIRRSAKEYGLLRDELISIVTIRRVQDKISTVVEQYGANPKEMLPILVSELGKLQMSDVIYESVTDRSFELRLAVYEAMRSDLHDHGGVLMAGIPTGLSYFDSRFRIGWQPGELIGLVGRTYIGKTWLLCYFGVTAWAMGKRVLFISPEMSVAESEARFDVLLAARWGVKVKLDDLYRGFVPSPEFRAMGKRAAERQDWVTEVSAQGRPFGVLDIDRAIGRHRPDIVIVDGLELLRGSHTRLATWEKIAELSYGLKNLAVGHNLAVLVSHQANRDAANTGRPPRLHEVAGGDAYARACDRILALFQPTRLPGEEEEAILCVSIQKFRKGKGSTKAINLVFEPGEGIIHERHEDRDAASEDRDRGEEELKWAGDRDPLSIP